jgi:hypothetical protein
MHSTGKDTELRPRPFESACALGLVGSKPGVNLSPNASFGPLGSRLLKQASLLRTWVSYAEQHNG